MREPAIIRECFIPRHNIICYMQLNVNRKMSQQMKLIQQLTVSTHVYSNKIIRYNNRSLITRHIHILKFKNINKNSRIHSHRVANLFIIILYYILFRNYRQLFAVHMYFSRLTRFHI